MKKRILSFLWIVVLSLTVAGAADDQATRESVNVISAIGEGPVATFDDSDFVDNPDYPGFGGFLVFDWTDPKTNRTYHIQLNAIAGCMELIWPDEDRAANLMQQAGQGTLPCTGAFLGPDDTYYVELFWPEDVKITDDHNNVYMGRQTGTYSVYPDAEAEDGLWYFAEPMYMHAESDKGTIEGPFHIWIQFNQTTNEIMAGTFLGFFYHDETKQKVSLLEQIAQTTTEAIESLRGWLFFWSYSGESQNVCNAISAQCGVEPPEIACSETADCGEDGFVGDAFCFEDDLYADYRSFMCTDPGTVQSQCGDNLNPAQVMDCPNRCAEGACRECIENTDCGEGMTCSDYECTSTPPASTCTFRTNAVNGEYVSGTWMALDTDGDDNLEGYRYTGSTGTVSQCIGTEIALTPEGYQVMLISGKVTLCAPSQGQPGKFLYKKYWSSSDDAELSSSPVDPYTQNGQEVCGS